MCGIVGYVGCKEASMVLVNALKKLEYRGYDSAGIAVLSGENIIVRKAKGAIKFLEKRIAGEIIRGSVGIGHTRWATHGEPSDVNAHPHTNVSGTIAVVHNGIIENYVQLKARLQSQGVVFQSQTDTEVIAHLINYYYEHGTGSGGKRNLFFAVLNALKRLEGSYALGVVCTDFPDRVIAARKESPLIVGLGNGENFIASDVPAVLEYTRDVYFLEQNELAVLYSDHVDLFNDEGERVIRSPYHVDWDLSSAEKGGWAHFMLKEIHEQPKALNDTLRSHLVFQDEKESTLAGEAKGSSGGETKESPDEATQSAQTESQTSDSPKESCFNGVQPFDSLRAKGKPIDISFDEIDLSEDDWKRADRVVITACGTAYHAAVVAKYAFEKFARLPAVADTASEFRYRNPILRANDIFIVVSQSGETADTLAALRLAKKNGSKVIAITNCVGSTVSREADCVVYTRAGPEIAVASTKAYTTQLACLYLLALKTGFIKGNLTISEYQDALSELALIGEKAQSTINTNLSAIQKFASRQFNKEKIFYIGRLFDSASSLESALKLKEVSYMHCEAFPAGELKHGPIALVDNDTLVIAIATDSAMYEKIASNILEVKSRGAATMVITDDTSGAFSHCADELIQIPVTKSAFSTMLSIIPAQLFAYYCAVMKGNDPDKPRNLAKSVTVE